MSNLIDFEFYKLKKDISRSRDPIDEATLKKLQNVRESIVRINRLIEEFKGDCNERDD
jgi:hypothetical protein